MYTLLFIALFAALSLGSLVAWFWAFRFGILWAGAENVTWKRLVLAFFTSAGLQIVAGFALAFVELALPDAGAFSDVVVWIVWMLCLAGGATIVFKLPRWRALKSTWPPLAVTALSAALPIFVLKPFVVEAFKTPSNSMAPTLVGTHRTATCPKCGSPAYGSAEDNPQGLPMICERFHVSQIDAETSPRLPSWRFAVGKLLAPQRWDLVVFRYPEDPSTLFVMRLVGLPGEEITIRDGAVWADGKKLELPKELEGLEYLDQIPGFPGKLWGDADNPAKLGDDEYFVLGDFSARAKDSRLWRTGVPGHPPYAVPRSHIYGVVTTSYWPPSRWQAFH